MKIKKAFQKIENNKFKISAVLVILLGILGFFMQEESINEWIFSTNKVFCIWWNIKFFALILSSYELLKLITNNCKKLAIIGTIIIAFSGTVQWNMNNIDSLIIGEIIVILISKFLNTDNFKEKVIYSLITIVFFIFYTFTFRPFAVAFGYMFLALIIWIIIKNKDKLKLSKNVVILEICTVIFSIIGMIISVLFFNNNNIEYLQVEGNGISILFTYLYNFLLPFYEINNKELFASIISIFPVPMIVSLYYLYKKEKHIDFLLPISIIMVFESVFCMSGFPALLNKITLFSETNSFRVASAVQITNFLVIFYFLGNIKEELFNIKHSMRITIILACLIIFIGFPTVFSAKKFMYIFTCIMTIFSFLFLNYEDPKYQNVFLFFLLIFTLIGGIPVNFLG